MTLKSAARDAGSASEWVRSSYSSNEGANCVEVCAAPEWVRSSHSSNDGPECVEVCAAPGAVRVRDSKDPEGPKLAFSAASWSAFTGFAAR